MTTTTAIRVGDRVSLVVNDVDADRVTGTVTEVYIDAAGTEVAHVHLWGKRDFIQATRFLTKIGGAQ